MIRLLNIEDCKQKMTENISEKFSRNLFVCCLIAEGVWVVGLIYFHMYDLIFDSYFEEANLSNLSST